MNEDIILLVEKDLLEYRRNMFKAGKSLEKKANITKQLATGLVSFFEKEFSEQTAKADTGSANLNIADISKSFSNIGRILLNKDVEIKKNLDGFSKFVINGKMLNNIDNLYNRLCE